MGWWSEHIVPRVNDRTLDVGEMHKHRSRVCRGLTGHLVEVGFGSALNASHYPSAVTMVDAIEPSDVSWRLAQPRIEMSNVRVRRAGLDGQRIDASDAWYDSALSTFSLCTIPDVGAALAEIRRVLKPGGALHFLEHGLSPDARVAQWQTRLSPLQQRLAAGCHLNRAIVNHIVAAGFEIESLDPAYLPGPRWLRPLGYLYVGRARA